MFLNWVEAFYFVINIIDDQSIYNQQKYLNFW